ncbi:MAG TPA: efflux RND transporter permease subunit [bacterium]|nr:efflux RND transporter permease subunit [bacterium]
MFLSDASVRRPVAMLCLIIALSFLGYNAYKKMGLEMAPRMEMPIITVVTVYPGAGPDELEVDVAKRIEDQVVAIEGLKHVTSMCSENVVITLLQFNTGVDVDIVAMDVREKIDLIRNDFPKDVRDPEILKFNVNEAPVLTMALTGDATIDEMYDFAANDLSDKITTIKGVAQTQVIGGAEREVHVLLDREALAARGLSSMSVVQAISSGVGVIPSGRVSGGSQEHSVKFDADFKRVSDIALIEAANEDGRRNYIGDFAVVKMGTEELRQKATLDGKPCVVVKVVKKADANAVEVIRSVRKAIADINNNIPGGMTLEWVSDDEVFTQAIVDSAWSNTWQGILLTAAILFLFLYNFRTTLIVAITMPITIVIGFLFMGFMGYSLNSSTLLAIGMSIGILVMNSIVVIEAIIKWLERTGRVKESSRMGTAEAAVAVIASAGTNLVVLLPIAMMHNMIGLFLKPFALTMVIMTAVSLFISFTLTPVLCSVMLKPASASRGKSPVASMERAWNSMFDAAVSAYGAFLEFNRRRRVPAAIFLVAVVFVLFYSLSLAGKLGMGFVPIMDRAQIGVRLEFPTGYNIETTESRVELVESRLKDVPGLKRVLTTIGKVEGVAGQNTEGVYLAQMLLVFPEKTARKESIYDLVDIVQERLKGTPDCIVAVSIPSAVGGQNPDIEFEIYGDDLETLDNLALRAQAIARNLGGLRDIDTTVRPGKSEIKIRPNRAVMADLGTPPIAVGMALRGNLEGIVAGTFKQGDRNYDIVVKFDERKGKEQVGEFLLPGAPGRPLLLSTVADIEETKTPLQIIRKDKRRISKLVSYLEEGTPLGSAADGISKAMDSENMLPQGYEYAFGTTYEMMNEGQRGLAEAGIIAIALIFLTLAAILESFKQPFIVLTTIPLSLIGVMIGLYMFGYNLSITVVMGIVMMSGIVVNNAILIMDQFNINVKKGRPRSLAMIDASKERFRPVVMITLAAIFGMIPMAFGKGVGSEMRNDIGVALVSGILVSGVLSVFVVPILYNFFSKTQSDDAPSGAEKTPDGEATTE